MKYVATIFIILSTLSVISGVGYLAIGLSGNSSSSSFSLAMGFAQIIIAISVLLTGWLYKKLGDKFKIPFFSCTTLYLGFIVYVVY
jgi:hypothetical protein